jgi:CRP-like cAMP-binding protein
MHDNSNEKFLLIRNHNFFAGLTDDDFESLNLEHHFKETKKGEYIYFESKYRNKLYFIKGGHVKIGRIDDNGNEIIKEIISEGEIFGQYTLEKNSFNEEFAIAYKSDVSMCVFTVEDFESLLERKPSLSLKFNK